MPCNQKTCLLRALRYRAPWTNRWRSPPRTRVCADRGRCGAHPNASYVRRNAPRTLRFASIQTLEPRRPRAAARVPPEMRTLPEAPTTVVPSILPEANLVVLLNPWTEPIPCPVAARIRRPMARPESVVRHARFGLAGV